MNISLSSFWTDGAVVQRERPFTITGKILGTDTGTESFSISFAGHRAVAKVQDDGNIAATFPAMPAGGPFELSIDDTIYARNIMIGELWFAAGQSNMELPLVRTERWPGDGRHLKRSNLVRVFRGAVSPNFEENAHSLPDGHWICADSPESENSPALTYHFAHILQEKLGLAVGLVNVGVGGSPIRAWLSPESCKKTERYLQELAETPNAQERKNISAQDQEQSNAWHAKLDSIDRVLLQGEEAVNWKSCTLPASWEECELGSEAGSVWYRKIIHIDGEYQGEAARLYLGALVDSDVCWVNGVQVGSTGYQYPPRRYNIEPGILKAGENKILIRVIAPQGHGAVLRGRHMRLELSDKVIDLLGSWQLARGASCQELPFWRFFQYRASGLFRGHSAPFAGLNFRGMLWYQGESDGDRPDQYKSDLEEMVAGHRQLFNQPELPVLAVQLPEFGPLSPICTHSSWAEIRDQQRRALSSISNYHLAVGLGGGQWQELHPPQKALLAGRLALLARHYVYGETELPANSPLPLKAIVDGQDILVSFSHAPGGLVCSDGLPPAFFSVSDGGPRWWPVPAQIEGSNIRLIAVAQRKPKKLRYAWAASPEGANIANRAGLPASPFELAIQEQF